MKEIIDFIKEMGVIEAIGCLIAWGGLFFLCFMMSIVFG